MEPTGAPATEPAEEIRDFTIRHPPIQFRIDDDVFSAPPVISAVTLRRLAGLKSGLEGLSKIDSLDESGIRDLLGKLAQMFRVLIPGASGRLFADRLLAEVDEDDDGPLATTLNLQPIDLREQAIPVLYYLLERYGLRPTQPSSSLPESVTDGNSTDGAPAEESIPTDSEPIDS